MNTPRPLPLWVLLAALMGGCTGQPTPDADFVVADLFPAAGKSLATLELSPTIVPTATFPNAPPGTPQPTLPLPTVVVLQQPTAFSLPGGAPPPPGPAATLPPTVACNSEPPFPFTPVWTNIAAAKAMLRCPQGEPKSEPGVWQVFERGVMFWRQSDKSIFVISDAATRQGQPTDKWWLMADTWNDGEAESDGSLAPPPGLHQPVRGFGKVWRANGFVREAIGWAVSDEQGLTSQWMFFEGGWMLTGPGGAPIYVMQPQDNPPTTGVHLPPQ